MKIYIYIFLIMISSFIYAAETHYDDNFNGKLKSVESFLGSDVYLPDYNIADKNLSKSTIYSAFSVYAENSPIMETTNADAALFFSEDTEHFFIKKGYVRYTVNRNSGAEQLIDFSRFAVGNGGKKSALTKNDAMVNAKDYVTIYLGISEENIYAENIKEMITQVYDEKLNVVLEDSDGYAVFFRRNTNGLSSIGSGGKITVYLSPDGKVVGHTLQWRPLEEKQLQSNEIYPVNEIVKFAESELKSLPNKVYFKDIKLGYYFYPSKYFQKEAFPVYQIIYTLEGSSTYREKLYDARTGNKFVPDVFDE